MDQVPQVDGMFQFKILFGSRRVVVVSPAAIAEVLVHKCYDFEKPGPFRWSSIKILGDGILFAEGDAHKQQRKTLMPAFAFRHVKGLYSMFWDRAQRMTKAIEEQGERPHDDCDKDIVIEVQSWASKATLSIIEETAMGVDSRAIEDPDEPLGLTYRRLMNPNWVFRIITFLSIWLPGWLVWNIPVELNRTIKRNGSLIWDICRSQTACIESSQADPESLRNTVIATAVKSKQFSQQDLVEQMKTFLIAGHETTATALTWAVYFLTKHPEMQKRLRDEVSHLPSIETMSAADIDTIPYLSAFTSEVLRFHPPVPITVREAVRNTSILSTPIPKGTLIMLMPWAINTSKKAWGADAQEFRPDRWLDTPNGGAESNYSTLTFLHGPRSCIGERFARGEFACLLAAWVLAFETELEKPDEEVKVDMAAGITVKPKGGLRVRLKPER